ncbi:MAG TPA: hypothetical protein PK563_12295 [Tenuifilaceae bacterium]|nr:hypothetical protein [Tenuifilaceae bacterium]
MKNFFLIVIIFLFSSCSVKLNSYIYGDWTQINDLNQKYVFNENSTFSYYVYGKQVFNTNKSKYLVVKKRDTLWLKIKYYFPILGQGEKFKKITEEKAILINHDYLTIISYKSLKGIENHIDEYSVWIKDVPEPKRDLFSKKKQIYVIPDNYKGWVWIAFNQKDGKNPVYDSLGNPMLIIPENGILKTTLHEDAFATANKHFRILQKNLKSNNFSNYFTIDFSENIDSICCESNENIAIVLGFNQRPRDYFNKKIFNQTISGNILGFFIGNYNEWEAICRIPLKY